MRRLHFTSDISGSHVRGAALTLQHEGGDHYHLGIVHEDQNGDLVLLDLQWHHSLNRDSPPQSGLHWIDPEIDDLFLEQVSLLCRRVWAQNRKGEVPFGFSHPGGAIDFDTGEMLLGSSKYGFTCASFVLAVFHSAMTPLVKYDTWKRRPEDAVWQQHIIDMLQQSPRSVEESHIVGMEGEIGATRYRPDEVAGAATDSPPTDFTKAKSKAREVRNVLAEFSE